MNIPVGSQPNDLERRTRILEESIKLFAKKGFEAVSMRDIATAVGITPAALYHHFTNKKHLHFSAMEHAFRDNPAMDMLSISGTPEERLRKFVRRLCERFSDPLFRLLLQRQRLDYAVQDEANMVAPGFKTSITGLQDLLGEIAPHLDKHLMANSVFAQVIHLYESDKRRRQLPGYRPEFIDPDVATDYIMKLLLDGIRPRD